MLKIIIIIISHIPNNFTTHITILQQMTEKNIISKQKTNSFSEKKKFFILSMWKLTLSYDNYLKGKKLFDLCTNGRQIHFLSFSHPAKKQVHVLVCLKSSHIYIYISITLCVWSINFHSRTLNQQWVLIVDSTKVLVASFFPDCPIA